MPAPVVFLDKDGTLIEDVPYNVDPAKVRLAEGAVEGLVRLRNAGYRLAVVSNQSGVARGYFAKEALGGIEARIRQLLGDSGVSLAGFFCCPHHPEGSVARYAVACDCRKPAPGMILKASCQLGADPRACWMVGDILDDIEAGRRAGCRTVLVDNGHETEWRNGPWRTPHHTVRDLAEAAERIVAADSRMAPHNCLSRGA